MKIDKCKTGVAVRVKTGCMTYKFPANTYHFGLCGKANDTDAPYGSTGRVITTSPAHALTSVVIEIDKVWYMVNCNGLEIVKEYEVTALMVDRAKFAFLLNANKRKFIDTTQYDHLANVSRVLFRFGYGYDNELVSSLWLYNTTINDDNIKKSFGRRVLNVKLDTNLSLDDIKSNTDAHIIMLAEKLSHVEYVIQTGQKDSFNNLKTFYTEILRKRLYKANICDEMWDYMDGLMKKTWEQLLCA